MDVARTVIDLIAAKTNADSAILSPATELTSLSIDSLDIVELIFEIEDKFGISIPYNASQAAMSGAQRLVTVGDVIDLVTNQLQAAPAPPAVSP